MVVIAASEEVGSRSLDLVLQACFRVILQGPSYYRRYYFVDIYKYILYIFQ